VIVYLIGFHILLLQIEILYCKTNHTIDYIARNFNVYFLVSNRKMFRIIVTDLNARLIFHVVHKILYVEFLYKEYTGTYTKS
jgi:hypothetical protein